MFSLNHAFRKVVLAHGRMRSAGSIRINYSPRILMKKQIALIAVVLTVSIALRTTRSLLVGTPSTTLTAWPSQVIFGLYFAILALAIQALQRLLESTGQNRRQALLLLMLIGICLDLVLVNVQEITSHVDASYGPVVIWDLTT